MKKILITKVCEGNINGRMRRLSEGLEYTVDDFLAKVLIKNKEAKPVRAKRKQTHTNKAMTGFDNK